MAARLGLVLYWIASGFALVLACLGVWAYSADSKAGSPLLLTALGGAGLIYLVGLACKFVLAGPKASQTSAPTVSASTPQAPLTQAKVDELNKSLKAVKDQLGFPPGTGPTHVLVDGELKTKNVGHTERMKNDPTCAFGNKVAGLILEISELENALSEATARSDLAAVHKIKTEIASRESEVYALSTVQAAGKKAPSTAPTSQRGASTGGEAKPIKMADLIASGQPITMANLIDLRRQLMGFWEKALSEAPVTGNWRDVEECTRVFEAFHDEVRKVITSENFSGDAAAAASAWDECGRADREYRRLAEAEVRWQMRRAGQPSS
jgi:hypothetical protein